MRHNLRCVIHRRGLVSSPDGLGAPPPTDPISLPLFSILCVLCAAAPLRCFSYVLRLPPLLSPLPVFSLPHSLTSSSSCFLVLSFWIFFCIFFLYTYVLLFRLILFSVARAKTQIQRYEFIGFLSARTEPPNQVSHHFASFLACRLKRDIEIHPEKVYQIPS